MLLRPFTEADLGWLTALHGDPAVMRYIDSPVPAAVVAGVTLPMFLCEHAELPAGVGHFAALREPGGAEHSDVIYAASKRAWLRST
jgi:hypothetical protein